MSNFDNDIPKYIKKKQSSVSKSKEKSNHKHIYKDCLIFKNDSNCPHKAKYCEICGKISDLKFYEIERIENGMFRVLDHDEVLEKYKDLEKFCVNSIWDKYVVLSENVEEGE